jgi:hypothetical protein
VQTPLIWTTHTPDRSTVWFLCTAHRDEKLIGQPDLVSYPARIRTYCSSCPAAT